MNILITGATSGIGAQLAIDYAKEGHNVYACGRNKEKLAQLVSNNSDLIKPLIFDITDNAALFAAADAITEALDIVILNAGDCHYIDISSKHDFNAEAFQKSMEINTIAMGYCIEAFMPKISDGGTLALMGSSASFIPFSRASAYGSSKAAIAYLAKSLAMDLNDIHVALISPGFVKTPLTDKNDFDMPFLVSPEYASDCIRQGIIKKQRDIHFPKKLTLGLKFMAWLPFSVWKKISTKLLAK